VLRFDMFCITSRVRQLKFPLVYVYTVRSRQNRCGFQVCFLYMFIREYEVGVLGGGW
jgi:hypothetical protein